MKKEKLSERATAYSFPDLGIETLVYLIETARRVWVIDTFCGTRSMEPILQDLPAAKGQNVMVVNTHFHWDHVWGNCAFRGEIISHRRCREMLVKHWERDLAKYGKNLQGRAEKKLPNITFEQQLIFSEEEIELFYSPGHTADSISLFDRRDRLLYVGDNLEKPLIYVEDTDLESYLHTLARYKEYRPQMIMAGHSSRLTLVDVEQTIDYLRQLKAGARLALPTEEERLIHEQNQKVITRVRSPLHIGSKPR